MIITEFVKEITLLLFLGGFYIYYLYKKTSKRRLKPNPTKPYYFMSRKELRNLDKEAADNINLRNKIYSNFNLMLNNHSISAQAIDEISTFINEDLNADIDKFDNEIHFIYHCINKEYISNLTLHTISAVLEVESALFFSNKSKSLKKIRSKKAKIINLYS